MLNVVMSYVVEDFMLVVYIYECRVRLYLLK